MLRVLHVIGKMDRAGAETIIMNIYRNIDRERIQFDFMVFSNEEGDYDSEIKQMGGKIYQMPEFKVINYRNMCKIFKKFFEKHSYEIVHGHIGSCAPAYLYYAKKNGSFTIAHSHNTDSSIIWKKIAYKCLTRPVIYVADYFMACSEEAGKDRFGKKIINQNNFRVMNNAIDAEEFIYTDERHCSLKDKFGLNNKIIFGHVGRFTEQKNHDFLIEVFENIKKKHNEAILLLVGVGEDFDKIKEKVEARKLEKSVCFLGIREDISDLMNLFDVFIFPSIYEGLGIVGIEAQAAGLPCFFSNAIPDEAILTPSVWKFPLKWGAERWATEINKKIQFFKRVDNYKLIVKGGYDIKKLSKAMEQFYLNKDCMMKKRNNKNE